MNDFFQKRWDSCDLKQDYWSILGFESEQQFKDIGKHKLNLLKSIGFTFSSNLLDVGCGTGTIPMAIFNDMEGKYYGCDISPKGIDYCKENYVKDNFNFFVNNQTVVLIKDVCFDFITFYSVFTHCYIDEISALLNQVKGYLKKDGKILADFFVGKYDGDNRYISAISQNAFDEIIQESGLKCTILSRKHFQDKIDRVLITLTNE